MEKIRRKRKCIPKPCRIRIYQYTELQNMINNRIKNLLKNDNGKKTKKVKK